MNINVIMPVQRGFDWRDLNREGRLEAIKAVYEPGMSASEIAGAIGGITRNAIIGMYGRYGDQLTECGLRPFRSCGRSPKGTAKPRRANLNKLVKFIKPATVERVPPPGEAHLCGLPLMRMGKHQCWFAVNDAGPGELHLFCAMPTEATYCSHHASRAFQERK